MRRSAVLLLSMLFAGLTFGADIKAIFPPGAKPAGPYSPGMMGGEFLYVAGQGAADAHGQVPTDEEGQIRQCLENVKTVVEAGGLTMQHVVYVQVYLTKYEDEGPLNRIWKQVFPTAPPARSTIGVAQLK